MPIMHTDIDTTAEEMVIILEDGELRSIRPEAVQPSGYPNPNKMRPDQYEALKASITRFGFTQPITVRRLGPESEIFEVVDGHHRLQAVNELGLPLVLCRVVVMTEGEARVAAVALNRVRGELDLAQVGAVFTDVLENWGGQFEQDDLTVTGFSNDEVADLLRVAADQADPTATALSGSDTDTPDLGNDDSSTGAERPFVLEISFTDAKQFKAARRALRKAAGGRGKELALGLLRVLDIE